MDNYPLAAREIVETLASKAAANAANAVAFQGAPGAYSHQAVTEMYPDGAPMPCFSFADAIDAVKEGRAGTAVIPIENSLHGRVADIHFLLPESGLFIIGEHFVRVRHCLLGLPGTAREQIREVVSHPQALGQCRIRLKGWGIEPRASFDTAASAALVRERGETHVGAIASRLAGKLYGLDIVEADVEDEAHNTTRFVALAREPLLPPPNVPTMTSLTFEVRSVPAALFKALGGFATNGVNLTKLESYMRGGQFQAAEFYVDIEGRPEDEAVARALDELDHFTKWMRVLGTYPQARPR